MINGLGNAVTPIAVSTSAPVTLSAAAARAATPDSVRHLFRHRSMPIIRPRLDAISARLRNAQVTCVIHSECQ